MDASELQVTVSEFVDLTNQTLEYAMPSIAIVGEISGYNVRQGKWVRFKLKDDRSSVDFFGSTFQVRTPLEDGMMAVVVGRPRLSDKWGFSVSIQSVRPVGEGSIRRSFELLQKKLQAEGLFDESRKRTLPALPRRIGLISSTQAAGYADFIKILNGRWGGMQIDVAHTLVQGDKAPGQIIQAINHFNQEGEPPEAIVIVRGGGDPDDLAAFNDEALVRAIAASRIPTLVGVGHETDTTLADLVADVRAATPSNAAQLLVPDRRELVQEARYLVKSMIPKVEERLKEYQHEVERLMDDGTAVLEERLESYIDELTVTKRLLHQFDPMAVLSRGYALMRGEAAVGAAIEIERVNDIIEAEVRNVKKR